MKKVIAFLLLFATLFLSACTRYENVKPGEDENGFYCLYQENRYYQVPWGFFVRCGLNESDSYPEQTHSQIGSFYSFPFSSFYFSYTTESPLYIYTSNKTGYPKNNIYFREDYDYTTDTFCIKNTSAKIVWRDIWGAKTSVDYFALSGLSDNIVVPLHSEQHSLIWICLDLVFSQGKWYILLSDLSVYTASDTFVQLLEDNGII